VWAIILPIGGVFDVLIQFLMDFISWLKAEYDYLWTQFQIFVFDLLHSFVQYANTQFAVLDPNSNVGSVILKLVSFASLVGEISAFINWSPVIAVLLASLGTVALIRLVRWIFACIPTMGG